MINYSGKCRHTMDVGKKIRALRREKLMTQSELAGTQITRNMLSCIENGSAMPSLSTVLYLAGRLGVPAGFLLADEKENFFYHKMSLMENIRKAFSEEDWSGCRGLCLSISEKDDDELIMILSLCTLELAKGEFRHGKLKNACILFDEALNYSEKTAYPIPQVEACARLYFRCMQRISPALYSNSLDEEKQCKLKMNSEFEFYLDSLEALDSGDMTGFNHFFENYGQSPFFANHLRARYYLRNGKPSESKDILLLLLNSEDYILNEVQLYAVLTDLEIACRDTEDFKGAYRYANERIQLHEQLLKN